MNARCRYLLIPALLLSTMSGFAQEEPAEGDPAETALWEQVQAWYEEAKEAGEKVPSDIYSWIRQDLESGGDWEYDIRRIEAETDGVLVEELNRLGAERWEVIWIEPGRRETRVFLKRNSRSYLRSLPIPDLLKLIPMGTAESN